MAYATAAEYEDYTGQTPPSDIDLRLARASRLVRSATIAAVYEVDAEQLPVDGRITTALREATIEQVAAWIEVEETGTGTGGADRWDNVQIGSVHLARGSSQAGAGGGGSATARLAPQALLILQQAGLTGQQVQLGVTWYG
ncbi:hypothetical protein ACFYUV_04015 [Nonomuraea sp. NPDC003560]|uniref:hypothetical protein n=1 Tax=Nonomuraea sp. NPDC003560 TaxID=3364341 RepID=UPI0036B1C8E8